MNKRLSRLGLSLAMCLGLLSPLDAAASTAKDWTTASSLTATSFDSADTLAMNISRCRGLFDISTGEVSFLFTLSATAEISPDAVFTIKYAKGNESCNDKSLDAEPSDACISIANKQPLTASSSPIDVRRAVDSLSSATNADACENLNESAYLYLIVSDPTAAGIENIYTVKYTLNFRTTRPDAPSGLTATAGGESIKVSWDATKGATSYKIYYGTEGIVMSEGATPESLKGVSAATRSTNSSTLKDKITSDKTYRISVTSVDANGNESLLGEVITTDTVASKDFWQSYREENADVDGGFCFIATAAYGSTQEPHVKILRQFRDTVLLQSEPGKKFVETYYRLSPPAAYFIGQHPFLRAVTRTALWPLYGFAYLLMNMPAVLYSILSLFAAGIGFLIYRRTRRRNAATTKAAAILLGSALAGGALCAPADAFAESPVNMMAEFKAGPYTPDNLGNAFSSHFGDNGGFIIEGEYDWQFWRGVGSLAFPTPRQSSRRKAAANLSIRPNSTGSPSGSPSSTASTISGRASISRSQSMSRPASTMPSGGSITALAISQNRKTASPDTAEHSASTLSPALLSSSTGSRPIWKKHSMSNGASTIPTSSPNICTRRSTTSARAACSTSPTRPRSTSESASNSDSHG